MTTPHTTTTDVPTAVGDGTTAVGDFTTGVGVIADQSRILGPDDQHTLLSRHNRAQTTGAADNPDAARDLYTAVLADRGLKATLHIGDVTTAVGDRVGDPGRTPPTHEHLAAAGGPYAELVKEH
ncbi:hypothetical protein ACWGI1_30290 [Streptomyces sp. NPDC054835]